MPEYTFCQIHWRMYLVLPPPQLGVTDEETEKNSSALLKLSQWQSQAPNPGQSAAVFSLPATVTEGRAGQQQGNKTEDAISRGPGIELTLRETPVAGMTEVLRTADLGKAGTHHLVLPLKVQKKQDLEKKGRVLLWVTLTTCSWQRGWKRQMLVGTLETQPGWRGRREGEAELVCMVPRPHSWQGPTEAFTHVLL